MRSAARSASYAATPSPWTSLRPRSSTSASMRRRVLGVWRMGPYPLAQWARVSSVMERLDGVARDHHLLVGRDDEGADRRACGTDAALPADDLGIERGVEREPAPRHPRADLGPDFRRVLADAGREDDGLGASEGGQIRAQIFAGAIAEDLDGQPGTAIVRAPGQEVAHVGTVT